MHQPLLFYAGKEWKNYRYYQSKTIPRWTLIGLSIIGLVLVGFILNLLISWIAPDEQFVNLIFLDGEVTVSDGNAETAAITGPLATRNVRTLVKTGDGTAGLQLLDGSYVILDSDSTIEFRQKNDYDPYQTFAFNLINGRALVVSEKANQTPSQILLGGTEIVQVFQATVGLAAANTGTFRGRVDCLEGQCLVNGVYQLLSGQNAQIWTGNIVEVTDGILRDTWILLAKASRNNLAFSIHFERILLALTNPVVPTGTKAVANQGIPITGIQSITSVLNPTFPRQQIGTVNANPNNILFASCFADAHSEWEK